jgi:hypothetical protein
MEEVESKIMEISTQIQRVDFYLKKPFKLWTEDETEEFGTKEQLRKEKEQLRKKEEQLRKKEEQLRKEKEQLTELLIMKERDKEKKISAAEEFTSGRSFENTFRVSFIKNLYNNAKGIIISPEYFMAQKAARLYSNTTEPMLLEQCRSTLLAIGWEENQTKFESIEIDCVLRCHVENIANVEFSEPAKVLLFPKSNARNETVAFARKISDNSIDGELPTPNSYIVVEITSDSKKLLEKLYQLEKDLLILLLRHQNEQMDDNATIELIISFAVLVLPFSPLKKDEMDKHIVDTLISRKKIYPLLHKLYELNRFARYFTQAGQKAILTEMSAHMAENTSSAHESSQLSLEIKKEVLKAAEVDRLTKELVAVRLLDYDDEQVIQVKLVLEQNLKQILMKDFGL